jgi:hypothetical protein
MVLPRAAACCHYVDSIQHLLIKWLDDPAHGFVESTDAIYGTGDYPDSFNVNSSCGRYCHGLAGIPVLGFGFFQSCQRCGCCPADLVRDSVATAITIAWHRH